MSLVKLGDTRLYCFTSSGGPDLTLSPAMVMMVISSGNAFAEKLKTCTGTRCTTWHELCIQPATTNKGGKQAFLSTLCKVSSELGRGEKGSKDASAERQHKNAQSLKALTAP